MGDLAHQLATAVAKARHAERHKRYEDLANLTRVVHCQWALVRQYALMGAQAGRPYFEWAGHFNHDFRLDLPLQNVAELLPPDAAQLVKDKELTVKIEKVESAHNVILGRDPPIALGRSWKIHWQLNVQLLTSIKWEELRKEEAGLPPAKRAKKQADATTSTSADAAAAKAMKQAVNDAKKARTQAKNLDKEANKAEAEAKKARALAGVVLPARKRAAANAADRSEEKAIEARRVADAADRSATALEALANDDEEVLDQGVVG